MNSSQQKLYWAEWRSFWCIAGAGFDSAEEPIQRKALHLRMGLPESSTKFSQRDLDHFLLEIRATTAPDDLHAQLAEGTLDRQRHSVTKLLVAHCGDASAADAYAAACLRKAGLTGIERGWKIQHATSDELRRLTVICARLKTKTKKKA